MPSTSPRKDGPSYTTVIEDIKAAIGNAQQKANAIQRKFVPAGFTNPRPEVEKKDNDSVFGDLVDLLPELTELNETLESIIECF